MEPQSSKTTILYRDRHAQSEPAKPRRLVFTALHLRHGGVERALTNQANALVRAGYAVEILCTYNLGKPAYALDPRVQVRYLTTCKPNRRAWQEAWEQKRPIRLLVESIRAMRTLWIKHRSMKRALRRVEADVLLSTRHEHSLMLARLRSGWFTRPRAHRNDTQLVAFLHHDLHFTPRHLSEYRRYYARLDDVILLNETLREEMRGVFVHRMEQPRLWALGNFLADSERIAPERKSPLAQRNAQLAFVGRLEPEKNPLYALRLFAALRAYGQETADDAWRTKLASLKLVFCGDGTLRPMLEEEVRTLGLQEAVEFLGMCDSEQVQEVLLCSRALLLTSDSEGFGLVVLEALDAGTPVVARDVRVGPRTLLSYPAGLLLRGSTPGPEQVQALLHWFELPESLVLDRADQIVQEYEEGKSVQRLIRILESGPRPARLSAKKTTQEPAAQRDFQTQPRLLLDPKREALYRFVQLLLRPVPGDTNALMRALQRHWNPGLGPRLVITANPEIIHLLQRSDTLFNLSQRRAVLLVPDGVGCVQAIRMLRKRLARRSPATLERLIHVPAERVQQRIPGVEVCQRLFEELQERSGSLFLFGAKPQVLQQLVERLQECYPAIHIVGAVHGYVEDRSQVRQAIAEAQPDVILAALGAPAQELFLASCLSELKQGILVGVGGSFDVLSGAKKRAPSWMRRANLEWLYRLSKEPRRILRFVRGNIPFLLQCAQARTRCIFDLIEAERLQLGEPRWVSRDPLPEDLLTVSRERVEGSGAEKNLQDRKRKEGLTLILHRDLKRRKEKKDQVGEDPVADSPVPLQIQDLEAGEEERDETV